MRRQPQALPSISVPCGAKYSSGPWSLSLVSSFPRTPFIMEAVCYRMRFVAVGSCLKYVVEMYDNLVYSVKQAQVQYDPGNLKESEDDSWRNAYLSRLRLLVRADQVRKGKAGR